MEDYSCMNYNESSSWQREMTLECLPDLQSCLEHCASSSSAVTIADYGSSEGYNSMILFGKLLSEFRKTHTNSVHIYHIDLPTNNWGRFFNLLKEDKDSYLKISDVYYSAVGRSFYEEVVGPNSVDLGIASFAFHFLSEDVNSPDHIQAGWSQVPEVNQKAKLQAHQDLTVLLANRYRELRPGARLILITPSADAPPGTYHTQIVNRAIQNLLQKNLITQEESKNLSRPVHYRTHEEWQSTLAHSSELFKIVSFSYHDYTSPYQRKYNEDQNWEEYENSMKAWITPLFKGPFFKSLNKPVEEKQQLFNSLLEEFGHILREEKPQVKVWTTKIVLEKI